MCSNSKNFIDKIFLFFLSVEISENNSLIQRNICFFEVSFSFRLNWQYGFGLLWMAMWNWSTVERLFILFFIQFAINAAQTWFKRNANDYFAAIQFICCMKIWTLVLLNINMYLVVRDWPMDCKNCHQEHKVFEGISRANDELNDSSFGIADLEA